MSIPAVNRVVRHERVFRYFGPSNSHFRGEWFGALRRNIMTPELFRLSVPFATAHPIMTYKILAVGEVLWDLLPTGKQLGGAPANFTYHCRSLGADARLVTRVGDDDLGREGLRRFRLLGLPTEAVQIDPESPTGTVSVQLAPDGQP